jgi:TetR/AcrR family transcriptional repressor of nem operon
MPWQKRYNEIEVLEKAMRAFWARGYEATSMGDLVEATGINRGSIYTAFANKHALFMRALEHYDHIYRDRHLRQVARDHPPRDAIVAVFETAASRPGDNNTPWGCLLVNTALELSPHDPEVARLVGSSLRAVERFFRERIDAARREGSVAPDLDSGATAKALLSLFLGLRVLTRANANRATLDAVTAQAGAMLD